MDKLRQLVRSPVKTVLGLVLSCLSCAIFCLCVGQFCSAINTRDNLESEFTTIALPNIDEATKGLAFLESGSRTQEIEQYLANLSDRYPEDVLSTENFYQTNAVADISAINIDASNEFVKNEFFDTDPRRGNLAESILYIRIDEIGEINSEWTDLYRDMYSQMGLPEDQAPNFGLECEITGTVLKAVALNGSYPDPSGRRARITFRFTDMDTFERYGLEPGMNCLVFGVDYKDDDRTLRRRIAVHAAAGINDLYADADWSRIREMSEEDILTYKKMNPKAEELPKYEYVRGSGKGIPLKPSEYDMMNRVSLTVSENIMVSSGEAGKETHILVSGDEITASEYIEQYGFPGLSVIEGDLDEYLINSLKQQGDKINSWGVGTNLITSNGWSAFGGVYKMAAIKNKDDAEFTPKIKLSENVVKITNPGNKTIFRFYDKETGKIRADLISLAGETFDPEKDLTIFAPDATWKKTKLKGGTYRIRELLVPIFKNGLCVYESPSVMEIRDICTREKETLWEETMRLTNPQEVYVDLSDQLYDMKKKLFNEMSMKD